MEHNTILLATEKLRTVLEAILSDRRDKSNESISLYNYKGGDALFLASYYKHSKNEVYKEHATECLNELLTIIENTDDIDPTHCSGIAGLGWLLCYLKDTAVIGTEYDDYLTEFEEFIKALIPSLLEERNYDLLHGVMGMGLFLLKRKEFGAVEEILRALDSTSEKSDKEIKWTRNDEYDFGLAHGNAGVLYFLGKCYQANVLPDLCEKLIKGNIDFFMNNVQDVNEIGSYFPYRFKIDDYLASKHTPHHSRLAWCYGDLGVLYTLYFVADILKYANLKQNLLLQLAQTTQRKTYTECLASDAGFCHGAAGNGYIYLKLYQLTKKQAFKDGFDFWMERTLQFGNQTNPDSIAGYIFEVDEYGERSKYELLTGIGGIGMFILSALGSEELNTWDECFFLS